MRINKYIADAGACSRREADRLLEEGRVTLNGKIPELGSSVLEGDIVCIDGVRLGAKRPSIYILLNKPEGVTCTTDARDPDNIVDFLDYPERVFPVGRLDKDSQGIILLTNDGSIVNRILRAENHHEKEYVVGVEQKITKDFLTAMAAGVEILDTVTKPCKTVFINERTFRIVLTQGLNRQIRRMCEVFGYRVTALQRVRIMNITIGNLKPGFWRLLTTKEVQQLQSLLKPL